MKKIILIVLLIILATFIIPIIFTNKFAMQEVNSNLIKEVTTITGFFCHSGRF